jgi:hypothetical protein
MMMRFLLCISATLGVSLGKKFAGTPHTPLLLRLFFSLIGLAGIASWWLSSSDPTRLHTWELYHHYLGARYYTELRYDGLYLCSLAVLEQRAPSTLAEIGMVRDLATNTLQTLPDVLPLAEACARRFSPSTWETFSDEVMSFKQLLGEKWVGLFRDHGFNPSPLWVLVARTLIPDGPVSVDTLRILSLVDVGLLGAMWAIILWSFPRVCFAVAAVFWGTNGLGSFAWTGGAFLRHDWLFATVAAVALLRKGRWSIAGALTAYATGIRVFPALLAVGIGIAAIARKENRAAALRFGGSFVLAGFALVAASVTSLGPDSWRDFRDNLRKHVDTRAGNMVGLPSLVDNILECRLAGLGKPDGTCEPPERISSSNFKEIRQAIVLVISLAFLAWLGWASRWTTVDEAAILAFGLFPLATSASSYYYEVFLLFGLLCTQPWVGVGLLTLGLLLDVVVAAISPPNKVYLVASILVVQFVVLLPALFNRARARAVANAPREDHLGS